MKLRRRPSFWLGLFVALFLAWASWDSYRHEALLHRESREGFVQCLRLEGGTYFVSGLWPSPAPGERLVTSHSNGLGLSTWRQMWQEFGANPVRVPDSLVFFSFLGLWVGWLALSDWRRKTRLRPVDES
jgi:hypothetical protein